MLLLDVPILLSSFYSVRFLYLEWDMFILVIDCFENAGFLLSLTW
jgi:hypothetical protein